MSLIELNTMKARGYRDPREWWALPAWVRALLIAHERVLADMETWETEQARRDAKKSRPPSASYW